MIVERYVYEPPIEAAGLQIIPVVRIHISIENGRLGLYSYSLKRPAAVILSTKRSKRIFRITGEELTPELFIEEFPDLY
jgi:hypothetical protein